jgi:chaperonin GroEL (HSP60 family)
MAQHYLAKAGILAVRRVKESDLTKLAKATGARIVSSFDDLFEKDLGTAGLVEERKIEEDRWVFIEGCKHPKSVTLLLRAGSQRVVDEVERSVHDALMVVKDVMELPSIVAGGGAPEIFAATKIRNWAKSLEGREQLAAEKFADGLESIALSLSENAGMDPIDTLASLRSRQLKGDKWTGIDVIKGKVLNMKIGDVVEPLAVKNQIISAATEAACMLLRIDDVIATAKSAGPPPGAEGGGMPPGMGGMGGMPPGMGMPDMGGMM